MSSKDELEPQMNDLPAYTPRSYDQLGKDSDGFSYEPDKKRELPSSSESIPVSPIPPPLPTNNYPSPPYPPPGAAFATSFASSSSPAPLNILPSFQSTQSSTTPLCFSRPRLQGPNLTYAAFQPMFLLSASDKSTSLSHGFPMSPPPAKDDPHPFVTHDVNETDWLQFLTDVQAAGSLTRKDIQRSHVPIVSWVPFLGQLSVYGVQKYMKSRKYSSVAKTVDIWNHHFFEPRKIRVVLMRGNEKLSGLEDHALQNEPVNVSSGLMAQAMGSSSMASGSNGKGKEKEMSDGIYRLFVLSN